MTDTGVVANKDWDGHVRRSMVFRSLIEQARAEAYAEHLFSSWPGNLEKPGKVNRGKLSWAMRSIFVKAYAEAVVLGAIEPVDGCSVDWCRRYLEGIRNDA